MAYPLLEDDLRSIRVAFGTCPGNSTMQFGERFWQGFFFGVIIFFVLSKYIRSYKKRKGMRILKSSSVTKGRLYRGTVFDEDDNVDGHHKKTKAHGLFEEIEKRNGFDLNDDTTNSNNLGEGTHSAVHNLDGQKESQLYKNNSDGSTENHLSGSNSDGRNSSQHSVGSHSVSSQEHKKEHSTHDLPAGRNYSLGNLSTGTTSQGSTSSRHYSLGGQPSSSGRSFSGSKYNTSNLASSSTTESSVSGLNTNEAHV
ncbi:hypothetical protein PFBG_01611 [Plasmodium falciparum 7G8]|uniref:Uncharacterized protein n=5 Tax=Plasmodium falciparum TaxID=5833 RepID=Q8IC42_PLAF7|nr:Plasmodium exported protein, unknown function [Plasmodium falciparum 3D7]ETW31523.1 hypothetical protein PFFCH_01011 [Plasmodium falciparum FCH/4]ETW50326.1 hypothetical protein PFMALIP_01627 [Plasmodium falciparum MaliPS096_E11]EUR74255.1 hypothetical protein PFBG_01611 [Plasmodium falciparum 7G8]KAF4326747.1 hypothetical protein CYL21_5042 [Plasmodium falciparum NF54]PKC42245.1 hypothetical protein CK202_5481 [Plasmodium falciparum NF54]|eukprot:XP_001348960.1 Plasmodium exported protein, unknown function [Plasmodium falciparum 3D7]